MREYRPPGSVRGAPGNRCPYLNTSAEKTIGARDGRWFTVRIMPYRTLDDRIDGVVITFADITAAKTLEAELRQAQAVLEKRVADQDAKGGQSDQ